MMDICKKNNWEIFEILNGIGKEIGEDFIQTCNTRFPTKWWQRRLELVDYEIPYDIFKDGKDRVKVIAGATVLPPITGVHKNVLTVDISSMYPTIVDIKNISSETINRDCCKDNDNAKIPERVMQLINEGLANLDNPQPARDCHYWICLNRYGKFAEVQHSLREKKKYHKEITKDKVREKSIKIFANSGFGCFNAKGFKFSDYRVAELITGFGRYILERIQEIATKKYGLSIIYGDTDSLFIKDGALSENEPLIKKFIEDCQSELNIEVSKDRMWKVLVLTTLKKQYFGLSYDDKVIVKGVTGIKDNQPLFFREVTNQLIEDALRNISNSQNEVGSGFTGLSAAKDISTGILEKIRQAFYTLETKIKEGTDLDFIKSKLSYSIKATRALDSYSGAGILQDLYLEIKEKDDLHESVNLDIQAGKVHYYYKIKPVTLTHKFI